MNATRSLRWDEGRLELGEVAGCEAEAALERLRLQLRAGAAVAEIDRGGDRPGRRLVLVAALERFHARDRRWAEGRWRLAGTWLVGRRRRADETSWRPWRLS